MNDIAFIMVAGTIEISLDKIKSDNLNGLAVPSYVSIIRAVARATISADMTRAYSLRSKAPILVLFTVVLLMKTEALLSTDPVPLIIYFVSVLAVTCIMLGGAYFLGQRHTAKAADESYESGIVATGDIHIRFSIQFYLLSILFVIFDMESVFLFAWSVAFYESGWAGFIEALIFIGVLLTSLLYLWACGALDWRTRRQRIDARIIKE